VFPTKKGFAAPAASSVIKDYLLPWRHAVFSKPQYRTSTVFLVRADIQFDIYRLFAYGGTKAEVYYGVACIPNYKTSVMMNRLFRRIPRVRQETHKTTRQTKRPSYRDRSERLASGR
jgi:hypothetical protein